MDTTVAMFTVKGTDPDMPARLAVICVEPGLMVNARPDEPAALLIEATAESAEIQVTCDVRSFLEPSLYKPVAVN